MPSDMTQAMLRAASIAQGLGCEARLCIKGEVDGTWFAVLLHSGDGAQVISFLDDAPDQHSSLGFFPGLAQAEMAAHAAASGLAAPAPPEAPVPFADDVMLRLAWLKQQAMTNIDEQAEAARLRFITPGSGQALEYQLTEMEAQQALVLGPDAIVAEGTFPLLEAEVLARKGTISLFQAAQEVMSQAQAWRAMAGQIKALRRGAKLAVEEAQSEEAVSEARKIRWPTP